MNIQSVIRECDIKKSLWEIIVCDNNSTDHTAPIASALGARVIQEPVNQISRARSTGASVATGKWLLFIDADTYPDINLMKQVFAIMKEGVLIGCGSTVEVVDGTLFNRLRMERLNPFFRILNLCGGAFILCERMAFEAINGFSTSLYAYEEFDFIMRLKKYGKSIGKKFVVLHHYPVKTSGRKGDFRFSSMLKLFFSGFAAPVLFLFYYVLPEKMIRAIGKKLLTYWYSDDR